MTDTTRQLIEKNQAKEQESLRLATIIVDCLKKHNGKKLTKKMLPEIAEAIGEQVYIDSVSKSFTSIQTHTYRFGDYTNGVKLSVPKPLGCELLPIVDADAIIEDNPAWFSGAQERIKSRRELLASDFPEMVDAAAEAYRAVVENYKNLVKYPVPDQHQIAKLHNFKD